VVLLEAINVEVGLTQAEVYYSFKNISGGSNQFIFTVNHAAISATQKVIAIPDGVYSLDALQEVITRFCEADVDCPDSLFTFSMNTATRKVSLQVDPTMTSPALTLTAVTIEFSQTNMATLAALFGKNGAPTWGVNSGAILRPSGGGSADIRSVG
jgi:hypothetical protein